MRLLAVVLLDPALGGRGPVYSPGRLCSGSDSSRSSSLNVRYFSYVWMKAFCSSKLPSISLKQTSFVKGMISWRTLQWMRWFWVSAQRSQTGQRVLSDYIFRKFSLIPLTDLLFRANIRAHCLFENNLLVKYCWGLLKFRYLFSLTLLCPLLICSRYKNADFRTFFLMKLL